MALCMMVASTASAQQAPAAAASAASAASAAASAPAAQTITVTATREREGLKAERTSAVGLGLPIKETPATVNVITSDFLRDSGARRFTDLAPFIPGVNVGDNNGVGDPGLIVRGFTTGTYLNGMRQAITSDGRRYLDMIDRIEIAKGPAGVEAGPADPGGTVNYITKKPQRTFAANAEAGIGDYRYRKLAFDITGPFGEGSLLQYRLIAVAGKEQWWRPGQQDRPYWLVAPSLSWDYARDGKLLIEAQHTVSNSSLDRGGLYIEGAGFDGNFTPRGWSIHQRGDENRIRNQRLDLDWTQRFSSVWSAQVRAQKVVERYGLGSGGFRNGSTEGSPLFEDDGRTWSGERPIAIFFDDSAGRLQSNNLEASLRADFSAAGAEHGVRVGAARSRGKDYFGSKNGDNRYAVNDNTIDLLAPDNDQPPNITDFEELLAFVRGEKLKSVFGQWQAKWTPKLRSVIGLRRDRVDYFSFQLDEVSGAREGASDYGDDNVSYRVAGSYDLTPTLTLFAGYSNAYQPQSGITQAGTPITSLRARSVEAGVKLSLFEGRALWSSALYQIRQDNIAACDRDPALTPEQIDNCVFSVPFGNVRIRGFESELQGRITDDLQLSAGLALQDAVLTKSDAGFAGNRFANTPRVQASAFATWKLGALGLASATLRGGVAHIGKRFGNSGNTIVLPAYTRLDAGASWAFSSTTSLDLNVENLLDKAYVTAMQDNNSAAADQVAYGNRRLVQVHLRHAFR